MADWVDQYLASLQARDKVEKANIELYEHCTKLQDQRAELHHKLIAFSNAQEAPTTPTPGPAPSLFRVSSPPPRPESPSLGLLRQDLAKAQHERSDLQSRLDAVTKEFDALKTTSRKEAKKLTQLTAILEQTSRKLHDRDDELKRKAKLVEDVQDENVTLTLQLNISEENAKKLKQENLELVERWMQRMGKEADKMNQESKFG